MKSVLREPLLHFLLLGAAIFAAYGMVSKRAGNAEPGKIVVSQGEVESIRVGFSRTWQRPPTNEELDRLIRDRVREEVYCREARALGLDQDDVIIRRRLRQKMEFITDDVIAQEHPSDEELGAYLMAHSDAFRIEQRLTFTHVYLNPDKHGENLARDAAQLLVQLKQAGDKADISELGDSFLLERSFVNVPATEVAKQFGDKFAAGVSALPPGEWQGPIESSYGLHLVRVSVRTAGRVPALADVRDAVNREWSNARRLEANERFYNELLSRYVVTIEHSPAADHTPLAASGVK